MKKVLFCLEMPSQSAYVGGIAVIIKQYLENRELFEKNNISVELFDETPHNSKWNVKKINNLLSLIGQIKGIKKRLQKDAPDLIHIHTAIGWTLLKDLVIIRSVRKAYRGKIVTSIHFAEQNKILMTVPILRKMELRIINSCIDKVVFLSQKTRDEFVETGLPFERTEVLYTFHNFEAEEPDSKKAQDSPLRLLFVGSIDKRKGILDLLNVLQETSDGSITLDICGRINDVSVEEEYTYRKQLLGDRVKEHGYVVGDEKRMVFQNADVLILPSYGEGMPIVIMEAMAASNAIISTTVGAIPEVVKSENGILIEPGDLAGLKQAIISLTEDKAWLKDIQVNNRIAGEKFGLKENISKLCDIYGEIL